MGKRNLATNRNPQSQDLSELKKKYNAVHHYCQEFCQNAPLREVVLGTSRFAVDLCAALQLPVNVAATSLIFLHQFINNFDISRLERPLICGSCVLLGWKYCEDFDEIRSVRKLNDICRQIFKLLMSPIDDSENESSDNEESEKCKLEEEGPLSNSQENKLNRNEEKSQNKKIIDSKRNEDNQKELQLQRNLECQQKPDEIGNSYEPKDIGNPNVSRSDSDSRLSWHSEEQKKFYKCKHRCDPPRVANWRKYLQPLSASVWTLRDEGREFNRMKDRIKLFESALLRCIDFEVGPTLLPFDQVESLSQILWLKEDSYRRANLQFDRHLTSSSNFRYKRSSTCDDTSPCAQSDDTSPTSAVLSSQELTLASCSPSDNDVKNADVTLDSKIDDVLPASTVEAGNQRCSNSMDPNSRFTGHYSKAKRQKPLPPAEDSSYGGLSKTPTPSNYTRISQATAQQSIETLPVNSLEGSTEETQAESFTQTEPTNLGETCLVESIFYKTELRHNQHLENDDLLVDNDVDAAGKLDDLIRLSNSHVIDFYRSPFCLLSDPEIIGSVAVWKAAVSLGFVTLIEEKVKRQIAIIRNDTRDKMKSYDELSTSTSAISRSPRSVKCSSSSSLFPLSKFPPLLKRFRQLYGWFAELEYQRHLDIQKLKQKSGPKVEG